MRRLLRESNFPDPDSNDPKDKTIVSEQFLELLMEAEDEQAVRELIEERARLVRTLEDAEAGQGLSASRSARGESLGKPCSRDQNIVPGFAELDAKSFVEAIT